MCKSGISILYLNLGSLNPNPSLFSWIQIQIQVQSQWLESESGFESKWSQAVLSAHPNWQQGRFSKSFNLNPNPAVVKFNQMFGEKLQMSSQAQEVFLYTAEST